MRATGTSRDALRARAHPGWVHPQIIHHPSSIIHGSAFTLIELLVVVAIIVMLVSILLPSLQRVRKRANAVACQGQLRQWGVFYAAYAAENDGFLPDMAVPRGWGPFGYWGIGRPPREEPDVPLYRAMQDLLFCPMATRLADPVDGSPSGGTFLAWGGPDRHDEPLGWRYRGSYGVNHWAFSYSRQPQMGVLEYWVTISAKNASAAPVFLDSCCSAGKVLDEKAPPPMYDAVPLATPIRGSVTDSIDSFCINRHDGSINSLFLDWSVRRVGLKELWTVKWSPWYDTHGPWTRAGGARPEDWPEWMRRFKDY
jgi:prepilin-type N-terminal cleavage/methylation domain-containing protein/prepilin-type processing-associated H-X9-DG protein